jgi:hypothetical protein
MKKVIRLTEADLTRIIKRVIQEQKLTPLEQGLKDTISKLPSNPGVDGIKKITTFCKNRNDVKYNDYVGKINKMINNALSGISNPLNVMGGGSIDDVANIFGKYVRTAEEACSVIKTFETESNLADVTFGISGGGDFYSGIWGDSKFKINTAQPANKIIYNIEKTIPVV